MIDIVNQIPEANTTNGAIGALLVLAGRLTRRVPKQAGHTDWRDTTRKLFVSLAFGVIFRYFKLAHQTDLFDALAQHWEIKREDARARVLSGLWRTQ